ncbi:MAG: hypothetical protein O9256_00010, partial [Rhizobiaceae bacterium]|nr:hypothetical protein [Rhizobiaceae bacterium]
MRSPSDRDQIFATHASVRIPLIVDTHSRLIADSVPGDRGHPLQVSRVTLRMVGQLSAISLER